MKGCHGLWEIFMENVRILNRATVTITHKPTGFIKKY
jgi:hypothetical protein